MTYNINQFNLLQKTDNPSTQTLSTSYEEINGSKGSLVFSRNTSTFLYKFSFHVETNWINVGLFYRPFMHIKLQKSNDNFSSNIEDIPNCILNFSGETIQNSDHYFKVCNVMFIVENLNSQYKHLRLVTRSYSSSWNNNLHTTTLFGEGSVSVFYEPILNIIEL
tara:strand:+ start:1501 stop:1992 length:492 start_codon:yes stop_codon:yes gene_type:complete